MRLNRYYPNFFQSSNATTTTLIIPSSNDLVDEYFRGNIDIKDQPSNYGCSKELSKEKKRIQAEIEQLRSEGSRMLQQAITTPLGIENDLMTIIGNKWIKYAVMTEKNMNRSDQPWHRLEIVKKNREKETVTKLIDAFRQANIGGVLILSPQRKPLQNLIEQNCKKYAHLIDFPAAFKSDQHLSEICDCIYFHNDLGIYIIEMKAVDRLVPMTIDERNRATKKQRENNPYEKAVHQLSQMLMPINSRESLSALQKLYILITGSESMPKMSGIICTPNAKLGEMTHPENLDPKFRHFHYDLLSSGELFRQFWSNEMQNCKNDVDKCDLLHSMHYQQFVSVMANCSVGRKLFGVNNAIRIAKIISEQRIDTTTTDSRPFVTDETDTIFLNAKQLEILNDRKSKYKIIFGPPGTGKTILVVLAAIDAAKEKRKNGKVIVFTTETLVDYMKRIFELNGFEENEIEVRNFELSNGKSNENDYIFVDECNADQRSMRSLLNCVKLKTNAKILIAISGQISLEGLGAIEERIEKSFGDKIDYRIFQLTEILRGTKSIINFWMNRLTKIFGIELQMKCGHSIIGESVDYYQYLKSSQIMATMAEIVKTLLNNNEAKNIVIICSFNCEQKTIESKLSEIGIAFGSAIEQDADKTLVAVEATENVYSREWSFVISVTTLPTGYAQFAIIASSRAIAHLTFIERNEKEIRRQIRNKCNESVQSMNTILSSFDEYDRCRNEMALDDSDEDIICLDLLMDIVANNYFPPQIKQLFPIVFDDCNTFDDFFDKIVNEEQWALILIVHHEWKYFEESRDDRLVAEYKPNRQWIERCEIDKNRERILGNTIQNAIEAINDYVELRKEMEEILGNRQKLFDNLNNVNGKYQFDLIAESIKQIVTINCININAKRNLQIKCNVFIEQLNKLLQNLNLRQHQKLQTSTTSWSSSSSDVANADLLCDSIIVQMKQTLANICDIDELNEYEEMLIELFKVFDCDADFATSNALRLMAISYVFNFDIVVILSSIINVDDGPSPNVIRQPNAWARIVLGYNEDLCYYYPILSSVEKDAQILRSVDKFVDKCEYADIELFIQLIDDGKCYANDMWA